MPRCSLPSRTAERDPDACVLLVEQVRRTSKPIRKMLTSPSGWIAAHVLVSNCVKVFAVMVRPNTGA